MRIDQEAIKAGPGPRAFPTSVRLTQRIHFNGTKFTVSGAGYSQSSFAKKLGLKEGFSVKVVNAPSYYWELFTDLPPLHILPDTASKKNFIHCFVYTASDLYNQIPALKKELQPDGMLWVSWYKQSSKKGSDVSEGLIRDLARSNGLVDIKVCAIDEDWSGLKLVIPLTERMGVK
jgi:hypothetical protein